MLRGMFKIIDQVSRNVKIGKVKVSPKLKKILGSILYQKKIVRTTGKMSKIYNLIWRILLKIYSN